MDSFKSHTPCTPNTNGIEELVYLPACRFLQSVKVETVVTLTQRMLTLCWTGSQLPYKPLFISFHLATPYTTRTQGTILKHGTQKQNKGVHRRRAWRKPLLINMPLKSNSVFQSFLYRSLSLDIFHFNLVRGGGYSHVNSIVLHFQNLCNSSWSSS